MKVIILAAGKGSRMKSATPKPLQPIAGVSMIDLIILACKESQLNDICVVLGNNAEAIKEHLAKYENIQIHYQNMSYAGSAAALFGMQFSDDEYLILNADMPLISPKLLSDLANCSADVALSAFASDEPASYGRVITDEAGQFARIVEAKDATPKELECKLCNGGLYKISGRILREQLGQITNQNASAEYYLTDICALALAAGASVKIVRASAHELMGVNDRADLARAQTAINERICDNWRKAGHLIAPGAQIDIRARLSGECEIASGVLISGECELEDCAILPNSVIESSQIARSSVGPMARVRPGCVIEGSKIGNFVECKAAILRGVKAAHLAYLGDCEVGEGSNIGCGVIVCNYDGVRKYRSKIGKNCFVGSNSNLIAPIELEDGAYIAAGSTLGAKGAKRLAAAPVGSIFITRASEQILPPRE